MSGKELQNRCDEVYITLNKNTVPNDPRSPFVTSGVRIGTPAITTRGLKEEDMTAFGVSGSMMSVKAYGIAAVMPAEGKEEAVKEGLQGFIDKQKTIFETYLADQYAVAENARLETLEDGTVLMVMCEGSDTVFDQIRTAIEA